MVDFGGGQFLGSAFGNIEIRDNVDEAVANMRRSFDNGIRQMGDSMQNFGSQLTGVGAQLTAFTAPLSIFGATGIKAASDFSGAMAMISARTGLTGDALEEVRMTALQLGADTVFSGQQAADAFLQLLTAGMAVEDAMTTLPSVLNAAAAGATDLGLAADLVTNVMAVFQLEVSDAANVVDTMSRAASSSETSLTEIGQAMQSVGGFASSMGISMEDTAAIMGIFAGAGVRGSEAGTQLRSMLVAMTSDSDRATSAWAALGTSLFDAEGNARDFDLVLTDMRRGLADKTEEEKNRLLQDLAGSYGVVGLSALLASDGIEAMQDKMATASSATDVAQSMMGTFQNTINSLRGSVETLQIEALTPLMMDMQALAERAIEVVNRITDWVRANPELTQTLVRVGLAISILGPALIGMGATISAAGFALSGLGLALGVVLSPVGLLAGAAAGLAYIFRDELAVAAQVVGEALGTAWAGLQDFVEGSEFLQDPIAGLSEQLGGLGERLTEMAQSIGERVGPLFAEMGEFFGNVFANIDLGAIVNIGMTLMSLTNPLGQIKFLLETLGVDFGVVFDQGITAATDFFAALNDGANVFDAMRAAFGESGVIDAIEEGFNGLILFVNDTVLPGLQTLANWFTVDALPAVASFVNDTIMPVIQGFIDILGRIWADVSPSLERLFGWFMTDGLAAIQRFLVEVIGPAIETWVAVMVGIWEAVSPHLADLYNWFMQTGLPAIIDFIEGPFTVAINGIISMLAGMWTGISGGVEAFKTGLTDALNWLRTNVIDPFTGAITRAAQEVGRLLGMEAPSTLDVVTGSGLGGGLVGFPQGGFMRGTQTDMVPSDGLYRLEKGERVLTPDQAGGASAGMGGGRIENVNIYANSYEGGAAAARGFEGELSEWLRAEG